MSHLTDEELIEAARRAAQVGSDYEAYVARSTRNIMVILDPKFPSPLGSHIIVTLSCQPTERTFLGGLLHGTLRLRREPDSLSISSDSTQVDSVFFGEGQNAVIQAAVQKHLAVLGIVLRIDPGLAITLLG